MIKYVLISDGSSDRALIKIIDHALKQQFNDFDFEGERADLGLFSRKKIKNLEDKIRITIEYYEPKLVFIHRDVEKESLQKREEEIDKALAIIQKQNTEQQYAKIIPIRMTESWLMTNEKAIRAASGNPKGSVALILPKINQLESLPDPKSILEELLRTASGLKGRRLSDLNTRQCIQLITEYVDDFDALEELSSFQYFKKQIVSLSF
jgi:hypothetical protein